MMNVLFWCLVGWAVTDVAETALFLGSRRFRNWILSRLVEANARCGVVFTDRETPVHCARCACDEDDPEFCSDCGGGLWIDTENPCTCELDGGSDESDPDKQNDPNSP